MRKARICTWLGAIALVVITVSVWRDVARSGAPKSTGTTAAQQAKSGSDAGSSTLPVAAGAAWAAPAAPTAGGKMSAAVKDAAREKKHVFALFVRGNDADGGKMKKVFTEAQRSLGKRALFRVADVSDRSESAFIEKYGINRAPLPLTLVFAPNGAIVKAFPGKVVSEADLGKAFAAPAYADAMKAMQDQKLVLLCVQGKHTKNNAASLQAARAAAGDKRAGGSIAVVQAAPEDTANAALLKPLEVTSALEDATVFILVPPGKIAGNVAGATTKDALWAAIAKGVSACSSGGCGPSGCGP